MKAEYLEKWVKALRSGDYVQGLNYLKQGNEEGAKHCCLGVLCDVAMPGFLKQEDNPYGHSEPVFIFGAQQSNPHSDEPYFENKLVPKEVMELTGLKDPRGRVMYMGQEQLLVFLNDTEGKTFAEIADIIEVNGHYL